VHLGLVRGVLDELGADPDRTERNRAATLFGARGLQTGPIPRTRVPDDELAGFPGRTRRESYLLPAAARPSDDHTAKADIAIALTALDPQTKAVGPW